MRGPKRGEGEGKLRENEECRIEGGGERPVRGRLGSSGAAQGEGTACVGAAPSFFPRRGGGLRESLGWLVKVELGLDGRGAGYACSC